MIVFDKGIGGRRAGIALLFARKRIVVVPSSPQRTGRSANFLKKRE
jgi:hypothetical protein